jgi:hypothetical protein
MLASTPAGIRHCCEVPSLCGFPVVCARLRFSTLTVNAHYLMLSVQSTLLNSRGRMDSQMEAHDRLIRSGKR